MSTSITALWLREFLDPGTKLCSLCGNTGVVRTTPTSPAGVRLTFEGPCICPNGRGLWRQARTNPPRLKLERTPDGNLTLTEHQKIVDEMYGPGKVQLRFANRTLTWETDRSLYTVSTGVQCGTLWRNRTDFRRFMMTYGPTLPTRVEAGP